MVLLQHPFFIQPCAAPQVLPTISVPPNLASFNQLLACLVYQLADSSKCLSIVLETHTPLFPPPLLPLGTEVSCLSCLWQDGSSYMIGQHISEPYLKGRNLVYPQFHNTMHICCHFFIFNYYYSFILHSGVVECALFQV